ncbi:MAG: AAA family ATPase [Pseudanabaenaceae cyanobacterium]
MAGAIILIGIPGSGKSTLAQSMLRTHPNLYAYISPDQIRGRLYGDASIQGEWLQIWAEVKQQVMTAAEAGKNIIYDATNYKSKYRREVIELLKSYHFQPITGVCLQVPLWICLSRNQSRSRQVPEDVIIEMHRCLVLNPPSLREGFDRLLVQEDRPENEWID